MSLDQPKGWWHPLWRFAVHSVVGSALFVVIAVPAVLLSLAVNWLEAKQIATGIVTGLKVAEYFLFGVDLLLFAWFVLKAAWHAAKGL